MVTIRLSFTSAEEKEKALQALTYFLSKQHIDFDEFEELIEQKGTRWLVDETLGP